MDKFEVSAENMREVFEIEDGVLVSYAIAGGDVIVPDNVKEIGDGAFMCCLWLTSVHIPESVQHIGSLAFDRCPVLASVTGCEGVQSISPDAFNKCFSLKRGNMPVRLRDLLEETKFRSTRKDAKYLRKHRDFNCSYGRKVHFSHDADLEIEEWYTEIEKNALRGENVVRSVTLPDNLKTMGERAFSEMFGLESITIPGGLKCIPYGAFASSGLVDVYILPGVEVIGPSAFSDCESLERVLIPGSVREIGGYAFAGCESLRVITIPEGVEMIGSKAFNWCDGLVDVELPQSLKRVFRNTFDDSSDSLLITVPDGCFEGRVIQGGKYSQKEFAALLDECGIGAIS